MKRKFIAIVEFEDDNVGGKYAHTNPGNIGLPPEDDLALIRLRLAFNSMDLPAGVTMQHKIRVVKE